jgi:hypothetical protein
MEGIMFTRYLTSIACILLFTAPTFAQIPWQFNWQKGQTLTYKIKHVDGLHDTLISLGDLTREEIGERVASPDLVDATQLLVVARRAISIHIAGDTRGYFAGSQGWWRPRYTPANASWLDQAEILIHAFKHYYLKRASWKSKEEFKTHVLASWPEYNHRYAHPFEWTWTNQKMHRWFAKHAS